MSYVSKICISMKGEAMELLDSDRAILVITSCRDSKNIGRRIFADLNYWRKIENGHDKHYLRTEQQ